MDVINRDAQRLVLTGHERTFNQSEMIVSKTDPRGIMTYVNHTFVDISGYTEQELVGKPHSLIRHPHMPRSVFRLLWDRVKSGNEIFAYVMNRCKNGDHYWVLAHVTPTYGPGSQIVGYHSSRRMPQPWALKAIRPLYAKLQEIENGAADTRAGIDAALAYLQQQLAEQERDYDQFIFSLQTQAA